LAIETFVQVQKQYAAHGNSSPLRLILAGGYDYRLKENIITLRELQAQCDSHSLKHLTLFYNKASPSENSTSSAPLKELQGASVVFLPSAPFPLLGSLLIHPQTKVLLYTPTEEHFGIVPLEAMAVGLPVLATNTGGPMESVVDLSIQQTAADSDGARASYANKDGTGLLRRSNATIWAKATLDLLSLDDEQRAQISHNAKARTKKYFSQQSMSKEFERCIGELDKMGAVRTDEGLLQWSVAIGMFILSCREHSLPSVTFKVKEEEKLKTKSPKQRRPLQLWKQSCSSTSDIYLKSNKICNVHCRISLIIIQLQPEERKGEVV
jgi:alpha-1,3/alpha-1,6-mannosyltransferase